MIRVSCGGIRDGGRRGSRCRRWKDRAEGRDNLHPGACLPATVAAVTAV